ncbi:MAG: response regulator, partial [Thermoflexales bacterium]|nr:response regulator [Thermoflexales bacterium]
MGYLDTISSQDYTILVVDDNVTNLKVVVNYLKDFAFKVLIASNGPRAISLATEYRPRPDLILLDVMMPDMDGFEVCQRLKQDKATAEIPIIFLTALASEDDKVKGFEAGAVDYVTKPVQQRELLARVTTHLRIQAQARQLQERAEQLRAANAEVAALNARLQAENLRMEAELEVTRRLQQMLLPGQEELAQVEGLDIAGFMQPADEVGGDYYDVLHQNGRVKIGIGDVTGHGLESGVVMLMVQTAVRTLLTSGLYDPVRFMDVLNRVLCANLQRMGVDKGLSLALLDYEREKQHVRVSGQHEQIIVLR